MLDNFIICNFRILTEIARPDSGAHLSANDFPTTISKEAINHLPLKRYEGVIEIIDTPEQIPPVIKALKKEKIVGFDTETRPTFRKGVSYPPALVQLAGSEMVYIFKLTTLGSLDGLTELFANYRIKKAGVAIKDDIRKLQEIAPFKPAGFVELSDLTQQLGVINTGLRSLSAIFLKKRISKGAQITNWSRKELTQSQIVYAATDAWISRELYMRFQELNLTGNHRKPVGRKKKAS